MNESLRETTALTKTTVDNRRHIADVNHFGISTDKQNCLFVSNDIKKWFVTTKYNIFG